MLCIISLLSVALETKMRRLVAKYFFHPTLRTMLTEDQVHKFVLGSHKPTDGTKLIIAKLGNEIMLFTQHCKSCNEQILLFEVPHLYG